MPFNMQADPSEVLSLKGLLHVIYLHKSSLETATSVLNPTCFGTLNGIKSSIYIAAFRCTANVLIATILSAIG
ncbi:hypothetical protein SERLADRAFT_364874 [Serpula lacrymans var. lacrymans S7.9]|uniref:Uncharacterized protein n=1 Tax=Serpula lacrymans var. lacrymans (strain S7.9) TaxID=578457 RepID=F8NEY6_SERL9|nr:uncharacterized protein SERLADRAFT_364874 [Serpula lacrymans var. lacrymans S7.9]EGO31134.1 hypothetical protein SERLADRAFT_364874 [Serpula lacrymans var. lacrymans S7.9]